MVVLHENSLNIILAPYHSRCIWNHQTLQTPTPGFARIPLVRQFVLLIAGSSNIKILPRPAEQNTELVLQSTNDPPAIGATLSSTYIFELFPPYIIVNYDEEE